MDFYKDFEIEGDSEEEDELEDWFVNSKLGKSIKRVIDEARNMDAIINPVVYMDILRTASALEGIEGVDDVSVKLNTGFKSGSVRISCKEFILKSENTMPFVKLLNNASGFSVDPRSDGGVHITISFKNIFIDEKASR